MKNRGIVIASIGTVVLGGGIFYAVRKMIKNNEFSELMLSIRVDQAQQSGQLSYLKAFDPAFIDKSMGGKAITLYTTARVESLVDGLHNAMKGFGTDEDAIYSIYSSIENQKKMSQVAKRYAVKYGIPLMDNLTSELSESERAKLFAIIQNKPEVQYAT